MRDRNATTYSLTQILPYDDDVPSLSLGHDCIHMLVGKFESFGRRADVQTHRHI